mgnify:CR=1 FL=1
MNMRILKDLGLSEIEFDPGTVLLEEGVKCSNVYVLVSGKVSIKSKGHEIAKVDDPGTILGEISVLMGTEPVATVVTIEPSAFYVIEDFLKFIHKHADACISVAQILACRLVNMNNHLVFVKEQLVALQDGLDGYVPVFPENFQSDK